MSELIVGMFLVVMGILYISTVIYNILGMFIIIITGDDHIGQILNTYKDKEYFIFIWLIMVYIAVIIISIFICFLSIFVIKAIRESANEVMETKKLV